MKKILLLMATVGLFASCAARTAYRMMIDSAGAKSAYKTPLVITPLDDSVTVTRHTITLAPTEEGATYTLSGYFNGQVLNKTKGTIIRLENAYLENTAGRAALRGEVKTEVSSVAGSVNYVVSSVRRFAQTGALQSKKDLVLGGSGTLYVKSNVCHGVEAEDVKIKGSGTLYLQGKKNGSALNCETLTVEADKSFTAYFLNAKNGIKADQTISIASGTFYLYNNDTAFKTDSVKEQPGLPHGITLAGGTFHLSGNGRLYKTEPGAYNATGATFIEE